MERRNENLCSWQFSSDVSAMNQSKITWRIVQHAWRDKKFIQNLVCKREREGRRPRPIYGWHDNIKSDRKGLRCEGVGWNQVTAQGLVVRSCAHCKVLWDRTEGRQLLCKMSDYELVNNNCIVRIYQPIWKLDALICLT